MSSILQDIEVTNLEADINLLKDDLDYIKQYAYDNDSYVKNRIAELESQIECLNSKYHSAVKNFETNIIDIYNVMCEMPILIVNILAYICEADLNNECYKQSLLESLRTYAFNAQTTLNKIRNEINYYNNY